MQTALRGRVSTGALAPRASRSVVPRIVCQAQHTQEKKKSVADTQRSGLGEMGDLLGPIGLTYGGEVKSQASSEKKKAVAETSRNGMGEIGDLLGPIGLTYGGEVKPANYRSEEASTSDQPSADTPTGIPSIHSMTTAEWRALYEKDGTNDLWLEDEFNAGSRLMGGRVVHHGGVYGLGTGEGPSLGNVPVHKVKIFDHYGNQEIDIEVPEDRYVLWEAEDNGLELPYACRMGCCTACAVRVKEGTVHQPEALGISKELRDMGYALMCVGYPTSDVVMETVSEDEIYDLQFGKFFAAQALNPDAPNIERDDFALSVANMDE